MNTHEILVAARNNLDRRAWVPYAAAGPRHFCAMGTISYVVTGKTNFDADSSDEGLGAREALRHAAGSGSIASWNDARGRTKQEVLDAFDRAISATSPPPPDPELPEVCDGVTA